MPLPKTSWISTSKKPPKTLSQFARRLRGLGLIALCSSSTALFGLEYELDAPGIYTEEDILYCTAGLRLHVTDNTFPYGEVEILAGGMRWDRKNNMVFLSGRIAVLNAQYQLYASQLGYNLGTQSGEAWDVRLHVINQGRRKRLHCDYMRFTPDAITFKGIRSDNGHGSLLGLNAGEIHIRRAAKPHPHRSGITAKIDDITIKHPRLKTGGVPILWLPVLYRDYRLDYPWTKFEIGHEQQRGAWVRARVGIDLPRLGDLSSSIRLRNDHYELAGQGYGVESFWSSPRLGRGAFYWFKMEPEKLLGNTRGGFPDFADLDFDNLYDSMSGDVLNRRDAEAWEFAHKSSIPGGALYLRWSALPQSISGAFNEDRFRADYLELQMQQEPLARRGLGLAWAYQALELNYDNALQPYNDSVLADRRHSLQLSLPTHQILGALHGDASVQLEQFYLRDAALSGEPLTETWRISSQAGLRASRWLSAWGYDSRLGLEALRYENTTLQDISIDDSNALMWTVDLGVKTRLQATFANELQHRFIPRIGLEYRSEDHGDDFSGIDVGDERHVLEADQQNLVLGLDNTLQHRERFFRMRNMLRFGLRDDDRLFDDNGNSRRGPDALVEIENTISGRPLASLSINAELTYNGLRRDWDTLDLHTEWTVDPAVQLGWRSVLIPAGISNDEYWQHESQLRLHTNRYQLDLTAIHREHGDAIDGYRAVISRTMIDGTLGIILDMQRDDNGDLVDRSISLSFALSSWVSP